MKVGWERKKKGYLQISGRRIDASAPPARAYIYDYGDSGFQPIYLVFPTPGCWEITGEVSGGRLTFVTLVEKVAEGPTWRDVFMELSSSVCADTTSATGPQLRRSQAQRLVENHASLLSSG
jgi:hypothetical protein